MGFHTSQELQESSLATKKLRGRCESPNALLRTKWAGRLRQDNLLPSYKRVTVATKSQTS